MEGIDLFALKMQSGFDSLEAVDKQTTLGVEEYFNQFDSYEEQVVAARGILKAMAQLPPSVIAIAFQRFATEIVNTQNDRIQHGGEMFSADFVSSVQKAGLSQRI